MNDLMILPDSIQSWQSISHANIRSRVLTMLFARNPKVQSLKMPAKYLITKKMQDAKNLTAHLLSVLAKFPMTRRMPNVKIQDLL